MAGLKRVMGGGGLFLTHYEATPGAGMVTFAAKMPGHIVPTDIAPGQAFYVHRHGWLCGTPGITPSIGLQQSFRGGLWGGDGFVLQKLEGQGRAWIELSGELVHYTLAPGQTLMVHPGHVGMFEGSVQFHITRVPGIANLAFGADGFYLVALTGRASSGCSRCRCRCWRTASSRTSPARAPRRPPRAAPSAASSATSCADSDQGITIDLVRTNTSFRA